MSRCSLPKIACAFAASGLLGLASARDDLDKSNSAPAPGYSAKAAGELAVAIRYLQAEGTSHVHIYLYRQDGKLPRQLTRDEKGQDRSPIFAPDGRTIVFTREMPKDVKEFWSVEPLGGGLRKLATAPEWYLATGDSMFFNNFTPKDWPENKPRPDSPAMEGEPPMRYAAPDGSVELVLGEVKGDEDNGIDGPGHGRSYLLRDLKSGKETKMGDIPGFEGLWELLHSSKDPQHFFHFDGALRVAFSGLHLNSTDGDISYALDLNGPRSALNSQRQRFDKFTIALLRQTMNGTNTFREAIMAGNGKTIGHGAPNTTQVANEYEWNGLYVVDTTTFGAPDGRIFHQRAVRVVGQCDLVVIFVTDDNIPLEAREGMKEVLRA